MTAPAVRLARLARAFTAGVLLSTSALFAADPGMQIPGPPLLPTSRDQCEAYSREMEAWHRAILEQHQRCLDARTRSQEPAGPNCSKAGCESLHQLKDNLSDAKSKNTSRCHEEVAQHEREQRAQLDTLQNAQRRAEDLADSYRSGSGAAPSPDPGLLAGDSASLAGQLAAVFGKRGDGGNSGLDPRSLPSVAFRSPFSDTTSDALRDFWQQDVKQLLLDGVVKILGDRPLAGGLDTAISSAGTIRGAMDFLTRLESAGSSGDRLGLAMEGMGAATGSGFEFAAGKGWLPPSYAVSGFAFQHAMAALNVAVHGSFERLQHAFDQFDAGSRGWDSVDRTTDFESIPRDMALAMCPICGQIIRFERAVTSTYGDMAEWFAH